MTELEDKVLARIEGILDPETRTAVTEMKLVIIVTETEKGVLKISFRSREAVWPLAPRLAVRFKKTAENVEGVRRVTVYCYDHTFSRQINEMVNQTGA